MHCLSEIMIGIYSGMLSTDCAAYFDFALLLLLRNLDKSRLAISPNISV